MARKVETTKTKGKVRPKKGTQNSGNRAFKKRPKPKPRRIRT